MEEEAVEDVLWDFDVLLDAMGIPERSGERRKLHRLPLARKAEMVASWNAEGKAPALDSEALMFIQIMKDRSIDLQSLDALIEAIRSASAEWMDEFVGSNGVVWLMELLAYYVFMARSVRPVVEDLEF